MLVFTGKSFMLFLCEEVLDRKIGKDSVYWLINSFI